MYFSISGIPAYIVVPQTAPNCKKLGIQAYGASIVFSEQSDEVRKRAMFSNTLSFHCQMTLPTLLGTPSHSYLLFISKYQHAQPFLYLHLLK